MDASTEQAGGCTAGTPRARWMVGNWRAQYSDSPGRQTRHAMCQAMTAGAHDVVGARCSGGHE